MKIDSPTKKPRGRPRSFDEGLALERAMRVFWKKGYEAASVDDLAKAMELTPPSVYATFGNKEALFLKALQQYGAGPACFVTNALLAPTAREAAEQLLRGAVDAACNPEHPPGCLATKTATLLADANTVIGQKIMSTCNDVQQAYAKRFARAQAEGDLAKDADPEALSRYIYTVCQGVAVQAALGATREQLHGIVTTALTRWP